MMQSETDVKQLPSNLAVDQEMLVLVDTKQAGPGRLSARIKPVKPKELAPKETNQSSSTLLIDSDGSRSVNVTQQKTVVDSEGQRKRQVNQRGWTTRVQELADGTQVLSYQIDREGEYEMELLYGGRPVPNTKRVVHVSTDYSLDHTAECGDDSKDGRQVGSRVKFKLKVALCELCVQLITLRFLYERHSQTSPTDSNRSAAQGAAHLFCPFCLSFTHLPAISPSVHLSPCMFDQANFLTVSSRIAM